MTRIIAYYLPQYYPIPENDEWWGPGFTEWTNVSTARPLFRGHDQPRVPADLGFYDLRLEQTRLDQAEMARQYGVEGFCYYHYWFGGGRVLLERPFDEVLNSGRPDFPFCLCWANHSWTSRTWQARSALATNSMLIEQTYPGLEDHVAHFQAVLPAFRDSRYIRVDGLPLFVVYDPLAVPDVDIFLRLWRKMAIESGLPGIHFVGIVSSASTVSRGRSGRFNRTIPNLNKPSAEYLRVLQRGFDAVNSNGRVRAEMLAGGQALWWAKALLRKTQSVAVKYDHAQVLRHFYVAEDSWENVYPTILPQWDRSPRSGRADGIHVGSTPELFEDHVGEAVRIVGEKSAEHQIVFLKAWNEWGEGDYVEPDRQFGRGYLEALRRGLVQGRSVSR